MFKGVIPGFTVPINLLWMYAGCTSSHKLEQKQGCAVCSLAETRFYLQKQFKTAVCFLWRQTYETFESKLDDRLLF